MTTDLGVVGRGVAAAAVGALLVFAPSDDESTATETSVLLTTSVPRGDDPRVFGINPATRAPLPHVQPPDLTEQLERVIELRGELL